MRLQEVMAWCVLVFIAVVFPLGVMGYRQGYIARSPQRGLRVIDLVAQSPESGGWEPETIVVNKGDKVRLRITGKDVVHGFAIGKMDVSSGRIYPGQVAEVTFTADRVGRFTFYCNVWCSPFHSRMRGTLKVIDPDAPDMPLTTGGGQASLLATPDVDIDAPHEAAFYPAVRPSAIHGKSIYEALAGSTLPGAKELAELTRSSPSDVYKKLYDGEPPFDKLRDGQSLSPEEAWDVVAYLWSKSTTPERLAMGEALYLQNCAACHGETGKGDGPGARYTEKPIVDFTQAETMAGGSSDIYLAKIKRGGMGTGMPYYGPLFTEEQLRSLVDYLWTFLFSYTE